MRKKERAQHIQKILDDLYPEPLKPLEHTNVYTLLIAVLLSAQCTDVRVNAVTPLLFARADNPHTMIKLSVEDIEEMIRSCGLSARKAQSIWELSESLSGVMRGRCLALLRHWKHFLALATKQHQWSWYKVSECRHFPWILISIVVRNDGG